MSAFNTQVISNIPTEQVIDNHISVEVAAKFSGYNIQYLRRLLRAGKLEAIKIVQVSLVRVRPGGYEQQFCSDGKVFRDGDHCVMFYFGVGKGGAHIMAAFSRDLQQWTSHPEPLYKAGGHPGGLDSQYAHKISLVYDPDQDTFYLYYCAVGKQGRCIGLLTSKKLAMNPKSP